MNELVLLDTNIFMYAAGKEHPYKNPCIHILKYIETKTIPGIVNTEIFQELLYRYHHVGMTQKGIQLCNTINKLSLPILSITDKDVQVAIDLFEEFHLRGISPRDTFHAANMRNNKIQKVMSADKGFDHFTFVERIDPKEFVQQNIHTI